MGLDISLMIVVGMISMISIPFVMGGYLGIYTELEAPLRLYLFFLILAYVITAAAVLGILLMRDACSALPPSLQRGEGAALACGWMRTMGVGFLIGMSIVVQYAIFVVWSYCERLKNGGAHTEGFTELQKAKEQKQKHKPMFSGLFGTNAPILSGQVPVYYGSLATNGMMGGTRLFGGRNHCTNFPPKE